MSQPPDPYRRIVIVGVGLIGGSLALAWRRTGFRGQITGLSRPETIREATALGMIDGGVPYDALGDAVRGADLIILSSPIRRIEEHLAQLAALGDRLGEGVTVSDVGSTKAAILRAAEALPSSAFFIGGHPMAGSEKTGAAAGDPFLFQNAIYVLTPAPNVPADAVGRFTEFVKRTGARVVHLEAETHDRVAAAISHLPQLLAVTLVNSLDDLGADRETAVQLAAGGFRDMTRIASSSYRMWHDIIETNLPEIRSAIDRFIGALEGARTAAEGGNLEGAFERAARVRAAIPKDTKGFLAPLHEILVVVEDKPGVIAGIANALARDGINIKDIEVLKVREGEGGTLRFAFESRGVASRAVEVLRGQGYTVRIRE